MTGDSLNSVRGPKSIGGGSSAISLSSATKAKLEALGIDTSKIKTEAQGQAILKAIEKRKKELHGILGPQEQPPKDNVKAEAKNLASAVGISASDDDTTNEILNKISAKLKQLRQSAGDDKEKLAQVKQFEGKYQEISGQVSDTPEAKAKLSASMDALANMNKFFLNLR
mgnify:CR=1 FL=1